MNPWTQSFEQYRQEVLGETKKKYDKQSKERWQDDDCDDKWYEKSDVDGKISDREKKEKKKHYAKEDIADIIARLEKKRISKGGDPKDSPLPSMKKYHEKKKKKKVKEEVVQEADSLSAQVGRWEAARQKRMKQRQSYERPHWIPRDQDHEDNWGSSKGEKKKEKKESVEVNHIDGSTTQIIDVVRAPAMVAAPKFSNWKEEMSYEALKGEKLDIDAEKGKVKNHVDINPTIKTEEKKNLDEGGKVKYYKGDDRDPRWGTPKGLKATPVRTEREVSKKLDRTTLGQSYEPEGEMIVDEEVGVSSSASMKKARDEAELQRREALAKKKKGVKEEVVDEGAGAWVQDKIEKTFAATDKISDTMNKSKVGRFVKGAAKKVFGPWKSTDGGSNRLSPTQATHGPTWQNNSYEPEGELVDEKVATGPRLGEPREKGATHPNAGEGEKIQKRTLKWMRARGKTGSPGLKDMKDRYKEHEDSQKKSRAKKKVEEHHKKPGEEHPIDESIFGPKLQKYLGKKNTVRAQPGQERFVKSMPDPQVVRGGKTVVPGGPTVSRWTQNNIKAMRGLNNSHEPQGEQIDEFLGGKPGDGYLGHPNLNIKNPLVPDSQRSKKPIGNTGNIGINVNKLGARLGDRNFKEEGEVLEATKYSKVKGKNYKTGRKSVKGGTAKDDAVYKSVLANIIKQVGAGGVQQSSKQKKKKKGEKGRKQIGDRKFSPAETIRRRKASAKAAYAAMTDTRGT